MDKAILKRKLRKLIDEFKSNSAWKNSEDSIQSLYTLDLLTTLGWNKSNIIINQGQEVQTGKKPDIILKDDNNYSLLVIESKEAKKKDKLDGKYQSKTFEEQLYGYCEAEGIYWGILTNFVEWRLYSIYQKRLYNNVKYAFHDILWEDANKKEYIDLLSDEGIDFLLKIEKNNLIEIRGKWDNNTVFYPKQDEIKTDFFIKLNKWRFNLRNYINQNYQNKYSIEEIDLITQKIIDRLIFIDYCSDNQILSQDILHAILHSQKNIYLELKRIVFHDMDEKFNSELFAHSNCDLIDVPDEIIVPIITELTAIDFNRLSVHVIGEVYENYLGELLKQNKKTVSLKKTEGLEKKKKQGIYYTPENIVDYIINNSLGSILSKCKTEEEILKIKVLDPACGSGSFLIRVFEEFLTHYKRVNKEGNLFEFETRKKILQNNIYGVDLDERAIEIAKLNLMIKALEGIKWQDVKGKKLLPNLKLNIRCGNSLISDEMFFDVKSLESKMSSYEDDINSLIKKKKQYHGLIDESKKQKLYEEIQIIEEKINYDLQNKVKEFFNDRNTVKPFNYSVSFCEVFNNGGFDVIIGNPPYINVGNLVAEERDFYMNYYETALKRFDIYIAFIEKGIKLLKESGKISFIIPYPFLTQDYGQKLRKYMLDKCLIKNIYDLSSSKIFENATVKNIIFISEKSTTNEELRNKNQIVCSKDNQSEVVKIKQAEFYNTPENMYRIDAYSGNIHIINKIKTGCIPISKIAVASWGARGVPASEFHLDKKINDLCKKMVKGKNVNRYTLSWGNKWFLYDVDNLYRPAFPELFESEKLIICEVTGEKGIQATYDNEKYYTDHSLNCLILKYNLEHKEKDFWGRRKISISKEDFSLSREYSIKFILGILNSRMMNFYFNNYLGYNLNVYPESLEQIPIKTLDNKNKKLHDEIVEDVENVLALNINEETRTKNQIRIKAIESQIDENVFKLYNLSKEEKEFILNYRK